MICLKRIYDEPDTSDGQRLLIDRLWPRGVSKDSAKLDGWYKEIAPSDDLRHWFDHDPAKWDQFQQRYSAELDNNTSTQELLDKIKSASTTTLLFAAHDELHNNAVVLKDWLEKRI